MKPKPYCEGCRQPASRSRWEFAADPSGRLCASCVAAGVAEGTHRRPEVIRGRRSQVKPDMMAALEVMHSAKLRGEIEPLWPGELSVYEPNGRSCLRGRSPTHKHRTNEPRQLALRRDDVRGVRQCALVDGIHNLGA